MLRETSFSGRAGLVFFPAYLRSSNNSVRHLVPISLITLQSLALPAWADSTPQPPPQFPIGNKFSRTVQKVTGITFLSDVIASQAAKKVLKKKLGGNVKVKVKTFGLTDLIAGKVKSVSVTSDGGAYKSVPLGDIEVASNNPIWYQYKKKDGQKPGLKTPLLLNVKAQVNNQDIVSALQSSKIASSLQGLKLDLPGLGEQQLQVVHPKVTVGDNMIKIDATLVTQGASEDTGVPIIISGTPALVGDKIVLKDMKVDSPFIVEPEKFAAFAEELLNPVIDFSRMDRKDHAFRLKELSIKKDTVEGGGQLLLAPTATTTVVQSNTAIK